MSALEIVMGEIVSRNLQTALTAKQKANYLACYKRDRIAYGKRTAMRLLIADLDNKNETASEIIVNA